MQMSGVLCETSLRQAVEKTSPEKRVTRLEHAGRVYWVKRPERLSFRMRLQKGDPLRAFERERAGYHALRGTALPVPPLVLEGPDYLVIADRGEALVDVVRDRSLSGEERHRALLAAASGLGAFHALGIAHGRPSLKDILWDRRRVSFVDFERFEVGRFHEAGMLLDCLIFAFSCFTLADLSSEEVGAALAAYGAMDHAGVLGGAIRILRGIRWLAPVARFLLRMVKSRDIRAFVRLLDWARHQPRA